MSHLIIRTDSDYVFRCLCRDLVPLQTVQVLVRDIKQLRINFVDVKVQVIYREANHSVDLLARLASSQCRLKVIPPSPTHVPLRMMTRVWSTTPEWLSACLYKER